MLLNWDTIQTWLNQDWWLLRRRYSMAVGLLCGVSYASLALFVYTSFRKWIEKGTKWEPFTAVPLGLGFYQLLFLTTQAVLAHLIFRNVNYYDPPVARDETEICWRELGRFVHVDDGSMCNAFAHAETEEYYTFCKQR